LWETELASKNTADQTVAQFVSLLSGWLRWKESKVALHPADSSLSDASTPIPSQVLRKQDTKRETHDPVTSPRVAHKFRISQALLRLAVMCFCFPTWMRIRLHQPLNALWRLRAPPRKRCMWRTVNKNDIIKQTKDHSPIRWKCYNASGCFAQVRNARSEAERVYFRVWKINCVLSHCDSGWREGQHAGGRRRALAFWVDRAAVCSSAPSLAAGALSRASKQGQLGTQWVGWPPQNISGKNLRS
jgi:hypothetical protein